MLTEFATVFSDPTLYRGPVGVAWAPGRINLIGEHTDYNGGYVLFLAINRIVALAGRARRDRIVRLWSLHFQEMAQFSLDGLPETFEQTRMTLPPWARYILAVASELQRAGVELSGFDALLQGDVPVGGGMSSSAALEAASVQAYQLFSQDAFTIGSSGATFTLTEVAQLCQYAEWAASKVRCGILDQAASILGRVGQAVLLDCQSMEYDYVPFDTPGVSLVVVNSGVQHDLANSAYNERRQQCEEALVRLSEQIALDKPDEMSHRNLLSLSDISWEEFLRYRTALPALYQRRAGYVIAENQRVLDCVQCLRSADLAGVGKLLWQTHEGLRDEYEVSCIEMDTLVELARSVPGVLGARMMGGGFGGCTINLVHDEAIPELKRVIEEQYQIRTGLKANIEVCHPSGGPGSFSNRA